MTYAAWNPDDVHTQSGRVCQFENENRTITNLDVQMTTTHGIAFSDLWLQTRLQQKLYAEFEVVNDGVNPDVDIYLGLCSPRHGVASTFPYSAGGGALQAKSSGGSRIVSENVATLTGLPNVQIGDILMMAIDGTDQALNAFSQTSWHTYTDELIDDDGTVWEEEHAAAFISYVPPPIGHRRVWFGLNGTWFTNGGVGNPETGANPTWMDTTPGAVTDADPGWLACALNVWAAVLHSGLTCRFLAAQQQYTRPYGYEAFDSYLKTPRTNGFDFTLHNNGQKRYPYRSPNSWRRGGEPLEGNPQWNTLTATVPQSSGKRYFECEVLGADQYIDYGINFWVGLMPTAFFEGGQGSNSNAPGRKANSYGVGRETGDLAYATQMECLENNVQRFTRPLEGMPKSNRCRMMVAIDFSESKVWMGVNNNWFNNGDPVNGLGWINSGPLLAATFYPAVGMKGSHIVELCLAADDQLWRPAGFDAWAGSSFEASLTESLKFSSPLTSSLAINAELTESLAFDDLLPTNAIVLAGWSESLKLSATHLAGLIAEASMNESLAFDEALAAGAIFMAGWDENVIIANSMDLGADQIAAWCLTIADRPGEQEFVPAYRYDNYGFDSFVEIDGQLHGLGEEGLFELGGTTDDGEQILATAVLPRQALGTDSNQRIVMMLLKGKSASNLTVRFIDADGTAYDYETEFPCGDRSNLRRVKIGKGWNEEEYSIVLENQDGSYAEVYDLLAVPLKLKRRRGGEDA